MAERQGKLNRAGSSVLGGALKEQLGTQEATFHPIVPPPITFTIGLDSFAITDTRSRHEDTDFVNMSLAIGNRPALTQTRALGNKNNGNFPLNMYFTNAQIEPGEVAVFTYGIVNNGHQPPGTVEQGLEKVIQQLAQKGAQLAASGLGTAIGSALGASIGTAIVPVIGTAIGALAGYLVSGGFGLIFADCDGPVAVAVHTLSGAQIQQAIANGHHLTQTDDHPGTDSATGCGSNSHYTVTWSVK